MNPMEKTSFLAILSALVLYPLLGCSMCNGQFNSDTVERPDAGAADGVGRCYNSAGIQILLIRRRKRP